MLSRLCQKAFTINTLKHVVEAVNADIDGITKDWDAVADTKYVSRRCNRTAVTHCMLTTGNQ